MFVRLLSFSPTPSIVFLLWQEMCVTSLGPLVDHRPAVKKEKVRERGCNVCGGEGGIVTVCHAQCLPGFLAVEIQFIMKIYYMFISRRYCTLLIFHVASLSLNNSFSASGKRCIQILHHLHWYEMLFSVAELLQLFKNSSDELFSLVPSTFVRWYIVSTKS